MHRLMKRSALGVPIGQAPALKLPGRWDSKSPGSGLENGHRFGSENLGYKAPKLQTRKVEQVLRSGKSEKAK